jgi:hypothetical protein
MLRRVLTATTATLLVASTAFTTQVSGTTIASAAKSCAVSQKPRALGPTYVPSLKVSAVSCTTGVNVVRGYYRCRVRAGGVRGTCRSKVAGFTCKQKILGRIPTEFDAQVTCTKGRARVVHVYTQFT